MKSALARFNIYLLIALALTGAGCKSGAFAKKTASTLRLHIEVNRDGTERNMPIPIYRASPFYVNVETDPVLNEGHVTQAAVVEGLGSFEIRVEFDQKGTWLLEQYTTALRGKRLAVFSQFGEARWLAAPAMTDRISDGIFTFTPDATREEAERIVEGLNNVAKKLHSR